MPNTRKPFTADQLTRFAEAVVAPMRTPMVVVDEDLQIVAASEAFCRVLSDDTDPPGQNLLALEQGRWDTPAFRGVLEEALPQQQPFDDVELSWGDGAPVYVCGRVLHCETGLPRLALLSFEPQHSQTRTATLQLQHLAEEIVATVREPMLVLDYDHRIVMANQSFYRDFRVPPGDVTGRPLKELGNGQWDIPELRHQLEIVLTQDRSFNDFEVEHEFEEIGRRTMLLNARRIDHLRLILLAIEDVTERRRLQHQQEILVSELAHRIHNLLAVIQSLAMQTSGAGLDEYRSSLLGRLGALAAAHNVLFRMRWHNADLGEVLRQTLAPFIEGGSRPRLDGPPVGLPPGRTTAVALIVHELATNAAKYGAFSIGDGDVQVTWGMASDEVWLKWREIGGPPVTSRGPAGFGTTLIERTASYQLGGEAELNFEPDGLVCSLRFSLTD